MTVGTSAAPRSPATRSGVNPGERYDVLIKAKTPGLWAFHCHILPHAEAANGMFGMVNTLIVVPKKAHVDAIVAAILA